MSMIGDRVSIVLKSHDKEGIFGHAPSCCPVKHPDAVCMEYLPTVMYLYHDSKPIVSI